MDVVSSNNRQKIGLQLRFPVILPASAGVQQVIDQKYFLEVLGNFRSDAVADLMACNLMVALDWVELDKLGSALYAYFERKSLVRFLPNRDLPYGDNCAPFGPRLKKNYTIFVDLRGWIRVLWP